MRDFTTVVENIDRVKYEKDKLGIFKYDTLDEAKPGLERIRTDLSIEIGGPSPHIKLGIQTRKEHTLLKDCITKIINDRLESLNSELDKLCKERITTAKETLL